MKKEEVSKIRYDMRKSDSAVIQQLYPAQLWNLHIKILLMALLLQVAGYFEYLYS